MRLGRMFGIGMSEIIVILVIALLVIGPDKLPDLARTLGKGMAEFKKASEDFRNNMHTDMRAEQETKKLLNIATQQNKGDKKGEKTGEASLQKADTGEAQTGGNTEEKISAKGIPTDGVSTDIDTQSKPVNQNQA